MPRVAANINLINRRPDPCHTRLPIDRDPLEGQDAIEPIGKDLLGRIVEQLDRSWWNDDQITIAEPNLIRWTGPFS